MALNRLNRDQILNRALDLIDSSVLDAKDRPQGTILPTALTVSWLQEALDYFQKKFPYQATVKVESLTFTNGATTVAVPSDYILDVKDGIVLANDQGRMRRKSLSYILQRSTQTTGKPVVYTVRGNLIHFWPKTDKQYTGSLYYYALDSALQPSTVPTFPDDLILVRYVWLAGREWLGSERPGTAMAYADGLAKELQKNGIGQEAEEDQIPFDPEYYHGGEEGRTDWLGKTTG